MAAPYPYITERNLSKGLDEVFYYLNTVTNTWASNMILIGIFIITMMGIQASSRSKDWALSFATAGFLTLTVGVAFWIGGFISGVTMGIVLAFAILGFMILFIQKGRQ